MVQALTKSGFGPRFDAADRGAGAGFRFWSARRRRDGQTARPTRASLRAAALTIFSLSDDQDTRRTHAQTLDRRSPRAARGGEGRRSLRHVGLQALRRALAR